jgi:hypothetical protein
LELAYLPIKRKAHGNEMGFRPMPALVDPSMPARAARQMR